jgi:SAM-dependent methyltransferase
MGDETLSIQWRGHVPKSEQDETQDAVGTWRIKLPPPAEQHDQDAEYCYLWQHDEWEKLRFHDYAQIFARPGLYEQLFYDLLRCQSPEVVCELLDEAVRADGRSPDELRVLDLGAGNGMVGERLAAIGARHLVGIDILPAAAEAAKRDRPSVYDGYLIVDMVEFPPAEQAELTASGFNALTCVAALGFADIPPEAFRNAFNLVADGGWVAFTLRDKFVSAQDASGFRKLIDAACASGAMEIVAERSYQHRLATDGTPLYYVALIGRKNADLPPERAAV